MGTDLPQTMAEERKRAVDFMERALEWPYYRLPLKRVVNHGFLEFGFLSMLSGPIVYLGHFHRTHVALTDLPQTEYSDFEAVYDDGWRID